MCVSVWIIKIKKPCVGVLSRVDNKIVVSCELLCKNCEWKYAIQI